MTEFCLLMCVVPHNCGEFISSVANKAGATGGTIVMGRGTAATTVLQMLGLGETSKDIVFMVVDFIKKKEIMDAVESACETKKKHYGILFSIDTTIFIKAGIAAGGMEQMSTEKSRQMITIIVNKGYAEDVMAAARKAGAGGGTIINARGTAREDDATFFGVSIVPEKEMLIILAESEKVTAILGAVKKLNCLSEPGSGIAFCTPTDDFTALGKN